MGYQRLFTGILLLLLMALGVSAEQPALPAGWDGIWKGVLAIETTTGKSEDLAMELRVAAIPGSSSKSWQILYGVGKEQTNRDYQIKPAERPNQFIIDEKNGLFIDNHLVGNVMLSNFLVNGNLVMTRFELKGDKIDIELTLFDTRNARGSKLTGSEITVDSYQLKNFQHGTLTREPVKK